jgi:nickel-dependent lactate racemase
MPALESCRLVHIHYDGREIGIRIPTQNLLEVAPPNPVPARESQEAIAEAMAHPVDGLSLSDYVHGARSILIIINDATRPTPTARLLDQIHPELKDFSLQVLVATGTHRASTEEELRLLLGDHYHHLLARTRSHDCDDGSALAHLGRTSRGTELFINRLALESDRVLVLGSVEPHYYAGWTGGRKGLLPGIAGRSSIEQNHAFALHHSAGPLLLKGNPCHEDLAEAVGLIRPDGVYGVNVVLDRRRNLYYVAAGSLEESFQSAVARAMDVYAVPVAQAADLVISVAEPPLDNDFYQMQKAIEHGRVALKKGGILLAVSACRQGLGPSHYLKHLRNAADPAEVLTLVSRKYTLGDHKAVKIAEVVMEAELWAVTHLPPPELEQCFIRPWSNPQEAVDNALARLGSSATVLVLPNGSLTVPVLAS